MAKAKAYVWVVEILIEDEWTPYDARPTRRAARVAAKSYGGGRVRKAVFVGGAV